MKSFLFALFILISFDLFAQTITPKPIYEGSQSLTIDILQSGRIWFGFQNPDYETIVDIKSFTVNSKDKAIELIDKAIYILAMNKTDRDQHIRDEYENVYTLFGIVLRLPKLKFITLIRPSLKYCN
jgi:hypothetical protein